MLFSLLLLSERLLRCLTHNINYININASFLVKKIVLLAKTKLRYALDQRFPPWTQSPAADFSAGKQTWWSSASSWLKEPVTLPENTFNSFLNLYSFLYWNKYHFKKIVRKKSPSFFWPAERQSSSCQCWVCATAGRCCPSPNTRIQVFSWSCRTPKLAQKLLYYQQGSAWICGYKTMHVQPRRCHIQNVPTADKGWKYSFSCLPWDECRMKGSNPEANGWPEIQLGEG